MISEVNRQSYSSSFLKYNSGSSSKSIADSLSDSIWAKKGSNSSAESSEIRSLKRMLGKNEKKEKQSAAAIYENNKIDSIFNYGASVRNERNKSSDTALQLKKLSYNFKGLSSKIIRSKTSTSARSVVSQARREVVRLKLQKMTGKYEDEEIQIAIAHASEMEKVARKKAKNLELEEMQKRAADLSESAVGIDTAKTQSNKESSGEEEYVSVSASATKEAEFTVEQKYDISGMSDEEVMDFIDSLELPDVNEIMSEMEALSEEMMDDISKDLQDMMDEMGIDDLLEEISMPDKNMSPQDYKMMVIKHRNKEMKDMVKADSDYLKAMFKHLEKISQSQIPSAKAPSFSVPSSPSVDRIFSSFSQTSEVSASVSVDISV